MAQNDKYDRCLTTMYGLRRFGIKLGLDTIQGILENLGNPQGRFKSIHVAGTNGKGSTASALATILGEAGYKTGLYTSPHLVRFNERICIDGRQIADDAVISAHEAVSDAFTGEREPTFFELTTAMAFYEFGRQNVDWAVIETGMGGRLDATNVIRPEAAVITNISREHQMYLGGSLAEIAREKSGIIKKGTPVITGVKQKQALKAVADAARDKTAPLFRLGKEFRVRRNPNGAFTFHGMDRKWENIRTGLAGRFQTDNAALVLATCEIIRRQTDLPSDAVRSGLAKNRWPGRLEIVSESPLIILDGAHNLMAARNLARFLSAEYSHRPVTLVAGILDDKPYKAMLKSLLPVCDKVIVTRPKIDRALKPEVLLAAARRTHANAVMADSVSDAVARALEETGPDGVICIAGSLYVAGEAKEAFESGAFPFQIKTGPPSI